MSIVVLHRLSSLQVSERTRFRHAIGTPLPVGVMDGAPIKTAPSEPARTPLNVSGFVQAVGPHSLHDTLLFELLLRAICNSASPDLKQAVN